MNHFRYVARDRGGEQVRGTIAASTVEDARQSLREQALFPIELQRSAAPVLFRSTGGRVSSRILAKFYSQMSDLLRSGVPLLRSLDILQRLSVTPRLREVLKDMREKVANGVTLADAMNAHQEIFGELSISMVRAGQEGGFLEDVFKRISVFTDRQEDLRGRVMGALAYPAVLTGIGTVVLTLLIVFAVPKFARIFDRLRARGELPVATEILLNVSQGLQDYGIFVLGGLVGLGMYLRQWARTPVGRRFVDSAKLQLPIFGIVFRDLAITRFNRVLGTLRRNGIPILGALRIAKDSTGNTLMKEAIDRAAANVKAGDKLATPLRASGCFPLEIVEMIEVAEESNNLENVLLESAESLEAQTTRQLDLAVRLLEPMLLLLMASITLVVVMALLMPIFKMSSAIK